MEIPPVIDYPPVAIPLQRFLLTEQCPPEWRLFDLYLFRDAQAMFYVGQSHMAFVRVWEHIIQGFKGRSVVGRFILSNWPVSMKFMVELTRLIRGGSTRSRTGRCR
jgi:hypothetical protein